MKSKTELLKSPSKPFQRLKGMFLTFLFGISLIVDIFNSSMISKTILFLSGLLILIMIFRYRNRIKNTEAHPMSVSIESDGSIYIKHMDNIVQMFQSNSVEMLYSSANLHLLKSDDPFKTLYTFSEKDWGRNTLKTIYTDFKGKKEKDNSFLDNLLEFLLPD